MTCHNEDGSTGGVTTLGWRTDGVDNLVGMMHPINQVEIIDTCQLFGSLFLHVISDCPITHLFGCAIYFQ